MVHDRCCTAQYRSSAPIKIDNSPQATDRRRRTTTFINVLRPESHKSIGIYVYSRVMEWCEHEECAGDCLLSQVLECGEPLRFDGDDDNDDGFWCETVWYVSYMSPSNVPQNPFLVWEHWQIRLFCAINMCVSG